MGKHKYGIPCLPRSHKSIFIIDIADLSKLLCLDPFSKRLIAVFGF